MKKGAVTDKEIMEELIEKAKFYQSTLNTKSSIPQAVDFERDKLHLKTVILKCKEAGVNKRELLSLINEKTPEGKACASKIIHHYGDSNPEAKSDNIEKQKLLKEFQEAAQKFMDSQVELNKLDKQKHGFDWSVYREAKKGKKGGKENKDLGFVKILKVHKDFIKNHKEEVERKFKEEGITDPKVLTKIKKRLA